MSELRPDVIAAWRLCIADKHQPQPRLGEFNWPWALRKTLDELEATQARIDAALAWLREANPDPARNGDLFGELRTILNDDAPTEVDSDTMTTPHLKCPACGASIRARMEDNS